MAEVKVCKSCGSTDVVADAWCVWNVETQQWELDRIFDDEFCRSCEDVGTNISELKDVDDAL